MRPDRFAAYLDRLVAGVADDDRVIGVVGLGSTARGRRDPDRWSDHDVWLVTMPGAAEWFRTTPGWLPDADRIVLFFRETAHGVGVLYDDGHLVEFAAFEPDELSEARVNDYAVLLDKELVAARMGVVRRATEAEGAPDPHALAGRFLTALVVAVGRHRRGERLSGRHFLAGVAVDHLLRLAALLDEPAVPAGDDLDARRRVECTHPVLAAALGEAVHQDTETAALGLLSAGEDLVLRSGVARDAIDAVRRVLESRAGGSR